MRLEVDVLPLATQSTRTKNSWLDASAFASVLLAPPCEVTFVTTNPFASRNLSARSLHSPTFIEAVPHSQGLTGAVVWGWALRAERAIASNSNELAQSVSMSVRNRCIYSSKKMSDV